MQLVVTHTAAWVLGCLASTDNRMLCPALKLFFLIDGANLASM